MIIVILIHRRTAWANFLFVLAEKYSEIPRELLVYLTRAIDEFDQAKMTYLKWVKELNLDLAGKTEEEKKKMLADPEVPELVIEQVSDLQEIEALQPEDQ